MLTPEELLSFQKWKSKGGGKGSPNASRWNRAKGNTGANSGPVNPTTGQAAETFDGNRAHCGEAGHRKSEWPIIDKIMEERRRNGFSPQKGLERAHGKVLEARGGRAKNVEKERMVSY